MKELEATTGRVRRRCPGWLHVMLAGMIVFGLGMTQGAEAKNNNPNKPILTKSGKKAALADAAAAMLMAPVFATDETKVPHYFGPFPNWANSPYTLPDVAVEITGDGAGATAMATVGPGGVVSGITITNPGSGYTAATVNITGGGLGATADALVSTSGAVTGINVDIGGLGYTAPTVTLSGGGATTTATATAYGGVDAVTIVAGGAGYTNPTVDFDLPDWPDGAKAMAHAMFDPTTGAITAIVVDQPGSGYSVAPNVVIRDGTIFDPIRNNPGSGATTTATLTVQTVVLNTFGAGYVSAPSVAITDSSGSGLGASATAFTNIGAVTAINVTAPGSGYVTAGGIKKFQDGLPLLCDPSAAGSCTAAANNLGQYLPLAVPDTTTFAGDATRPDADYYVIAVVQHREKMHSNLPPTLLREYVQLETPANASWSRHVALQTAMLDGTSVPTLMPDGSQAYAVDDPHFLGPLIVTKKDKPVRIVFYNLLPKGSDGDLFMPTDSTIMGSGMGPIAMPDPADLGTVLDGVRNPMCTEYPKSADCFKDNRATLHLHGGITPWISDGTPHQWITPASEATP